MRLFFFGSLLDPDLFRIVIGRPLASVPHAPARLDGWAPRRVAEEDYPVLVEEPGAAAHGRVVAGLSWGEVDRCLFYEGDEYDLCPIAVALDPAHATRVAQAGAPAETTAPRPDRLHAHAYLSNGRLTETEEVWRLDVWQAAHKPDALAIADAWMALHGRLPIAEAERHWDRIRDEACRRTALLAATADV